VVAGSGCLLLAAGASALVARRGAAAPGGVVAAAVAGLVLMPMVVGPIAGWEPLLPQGTSPAGSSGCGPGSEHWVALSWAGPCVPG
jgi:hypothetical protein